jgi:hypothetical protein
MNTLALHGLEEPFFISSCAVVSLFYSGDFFLAICFQGSSDTDCFGIDFF